MRFEVLYPTGARHEVELEGTLAVLGRDPSCDLVLNDSKCSRRHAVIEASAQGLVIRDSGAANGVYVNGKKVERAGLSEGDVIRLGEVSLTVLPDEVAGTLVMGPDDMKEISGGGAPPAPPPRPAAPAAPSGATPRPARPTAPMPPVPPQPSPKRPSAPRLPERPTLPQGGVPPPRALAGAAEPIPRPLTLAVLSLFWLLWALLYGLSALGFALLPRQAASAAVIIAAGLAAVLSMLSLILGAGLWLRGGWARYLQMVVAFFGLLTCIFTPASAVILAYMLREEVKIQFSGRRIMSQLSPGEADLVRGGGSDGVFGAGIVLSLLFAIVATAGTAIYAVPRYLLGGAPPGTPVTDAAVISQLASLATAENQFREGTCRTGYGDLEGLTNPASVIANYAAGGPPFIAADKIPPTNRGYRFELTVQDPVPPSVCPSRSFRLFVYTATPETGTGPHYRVGPDTLIRVAEGREATEADPIVTP